MAEPAQESLEQRLSRFPPERYPVQHATTRFHLGSQLLQAGDVAGALKELAVARDVFVRCGMPLETGKATLMLGVALRSAGRLPDAVDAFVAADEVLAGLPLQPERAAAAYNLGLVRHDCGDLDGAHAAWASARQLFLAVGHPAQAAAAARDSGAARLAAGDVDAAVPLLEQAAELAERAGDDPGTAAAANGLGLAHLAAGDAVCAVAVLRRALAFAPRATRPADHAMVKANLALAHERAAEPSRARLAAAQALALASAAPPVRAQARAVLERLPGSLSDDLLTVLDEQDREQWPAVVREEVARVGESTAAELRAWMAGYLDGVLTRTERSHDLAQALLTVLLEMPPRSYQVLVRAVVEACAGRPEPDADRLRGVVCSAMARFAMPQWQRLAASLNAAAESAGEPATWR